MFDLHLWLTFAVQGITEFLPVSSTAHMLLFSKFCQLSPLGVAETAALHLIPGLILLGAFWRGVLEVLQGFGLWIGQTFLYKRNRMTSNKVQTDKTEESHKDASSLSFFRAAFWGTVPALLVGAILGFCHIELPHSIRVIGTNSIIFGVLMGFIDLTTPVLPQKQWDEHSGKIWGLMHILAFVPGVSRLGICLTTARALGFSREESARFSFLCGTPILLMAGIFGLLKASNDLANVFFSANALMLFGGTFLLGGATLWLFLKYLRHHTLLLLAIYRICLGLLLLLSF